MRYTTFIATVLLSLVCLPGICAASELAPTVPDLNLPSETEEQTSPAPAAKAQTPKAAAVETPKKTTSSKTKAAPAAKGNKEISITTANVSNDEVMVQKMNPTLPPVTMEKVREEMGQQASAPVEKVAEPANRGTGRRTVTEAGVTAAGGTVTKAVPVREETIDPTTSTKTARVTYKPVSDRDPMLSPDDVLLLKHREEERLRAIELEKQRKIEAEKRRLAELERQRQLELERLRDPSREIRGKIHINGIIGQEVFIGDKVYTVGKSVLGAKIISIQPDAVVFLYKGQKFTKKVTLK